MAALSVTRLLGFPRGALTLGGALGSLLSWTPLGALALFAVPKKRVSKSRIRIRRAGQLAQRGPRLVTNAYSCPACGEQKLPHRVCGRPDCTTLPGNHRRPDSAPSSDSSGPTAAA